MSSTSLAVDTIRKNRSSHNKGRWEARHLKLSEIIQIQETCRQFEEKHFHDLEVQAMVKQGFVPATDMYIGYDSLGRLMV